MRFRAVGASEKNLILGVFYRLQYTVQYTVQYTAQDTVQHTVQCTVTFSRRRRERFVFDFRHFL